MKFIIIISITIFINKTIHAIDCLSQKITNQDIQYVKQKILDTVKIKNQKKHSHKKHVKSFETKFVIPLIETPPIESLSFETLDEFDLLDSQKQTTICSSIHSYKKNRTAEILYWMPNKFDSINGYLKNVFFKYYMLNPKNIDVRFQITLYNIRMDDSVNSFWGGVHPIPDTILYRDTINFQIFKKFKNENYHGFRYGVFRNSKLKKISVLPIKIPVLHQRGWYLGIKPIDTTAFLLALKFVNNREKTNVEPYAYIKDHKNKLYYFHSSSYTKAFPSQIKASKKFEDFINTYPISQQLKPYFEENIYLKYELDNYKQEGISFFNLDIKYIVEEY